MPISTLTIKGQTTIPKDVRARLGLHVGDRIEYVLDVEGRVLMLPATRHVDDLAGMLRRPERARPVSLEEMDAAIRDGFANALLAGTNRLHGCETTATLDRKAGRLETMRLLPS